MENITAAIARTNMPTTSVESAIAIMEKRIFDASIASKESVTVCNSLLNHAGPDRSISFEVEPLKSLRAELIKRNFTVTDTTVFNNIPTVTVGW